MLQRGCWQTNIWGIGEKATITLHTYFVPYSVYMLFFKQLFIQYIFIECQITHFEKKDSKFPQITFNKEEIALYTYTFLNVCQNLGSMILVYINCYKGS